MTKRKRVEIKVIIGGKEYIISEPSDINYIKDDVEIRKEESIKINIPKSHCSVCDIKLTYVNMGEVGIIGVMEGKGKYPESGMCIPCERDNKINKIINQ